MVALCRGGGKRWGFERSVAVEGLERFEPNSKEVAYAFIC